MNAPRDGLSPSVKLPPHAMEAEMSVLGGLMLNNRPWDEVAGLIIADDFYTQQHRLIFYAIGDLLAENCPCDFVTLTEKLRDQGNLENAGGQYYLGSLVADTAGSSNIVAYAELIHEKSIMRRLIAAGQDIAELGYRAGTRDPSSLVNLAVQIVSTIQSQRLGRSSSQSFLTLAQTSIELLRREGELRRAGRLIGACTGLEEFDSLTGGFHGPRLILLAARPKCGKTALLNKLSLTSAKAGISGFVCSIEMGAPETAARILANEGKTNISRILRGEEVELRRAEGSVAKLGDLPLWLDFETNRLDAICAQIALHKQQKDIQWAAVDHIGLISTAERFNTTNDRIGHISQTLKRLAKRLGIPIIALSQLGRNCDLNGGRRPVASDLRDSGNLEQDADMVVMLHVAQSERLKPERRAFLGITANRAGPSMWLPKPYIFDGKYQDFLIDNGPAPTGYDDLPPPAEHWSNG